MKRTTFGDGRVNIELYFRHVEIVMILRYKSRDIKESVGYASLELMRKISLEI